MKKIFKSLLLTLLAVAMMLNTCGLVLAGETASIRVYEEVVEEEDGIKKLCFAATLPADATFMVTSVAFSWDNTVIQPVRASSYADVEITESTSATNLKRPFTAISNDDYEFQFAPPLAVVDGTRTGMLVDSYTEDEATMEGEFVFTEFYYRVLDAEALNSETFQLEKKGSAIFSKFYSTNDSQTIMVGDYKYADNTGAADTMSVSTFTYEGSDRLVLKELALSASADSVNVPVKYPVEEAAKTVTLTATATSTIGTSMDVPASATWSLEAGAPTGVTLAGNVLTVAKNAEAGTAIVKIASGNISATKEITIVKAAPVATEIEVKANGAAIANNALTVVKPATATASAKTVNFTTAIYDQYGATVTDNVEMYIDDGTTAPDGVSLAEGVLAITNAAVEGSFDVTFKVGELMKTIAVSVVGLEVNWNEVTVADSITYGATNASAVTLPAAGTATVDGTTVNGVYAVDNGTTVQNAGAATITVKFTANANQGDYSGIEIAKTYDITIEKAAATITADAEQTVAYTGAAVVPAATIDNAESVLAYTYEKDGEPVADATKAGIYTVRINAAEATNYAAADEKVVTLTITTTATVTLSNIIVAESSLAAAEAYTDIRFPATVEVAYGDDTTGTIAEPTWSKTLAELKAVEVGGSVKVALEGSAFPTWITAVSGAEFDFAVTDKFPVDVEITMATEGVYGTAMTAATADQVDVGNGIDVSGTEDFTILYTGMTANGEEYSSEDVPTEAGNYTVTATLVSSTHAGSASEAFVIAPLAASATVNNDERKYSDADPDFTCDVEGLLEGDELNPVFSTTATATSPVGTYPITAVAGNKNYNVTWTEGTLTIAAKPLSETEFVPVISGATGRGATLELAVEGLAADQYDIEWSTSITDATYTLAWADSNSDITVTITGKGNYTGEKTSEAVTIPKYELEGAIAYTLANGAESDAAKLDVGDTVTVDVSGVIPAYVFDELGATDTYSWYLDDVVIEGATANAYTLVEGNTGILSVKLTVGGNFTGEFALEIGEIGKAPLAGTITITETEGVLTADTTAVSGVAGTDYDVVWTIEETEITLTEGAYTITPADYGKTVTVKAIAKGDVYSGEVVATYAIPAQKPEVTSVTATATTSSIAVAVEALANGSDIASYTITITDGAEYTDTYTGAANTATFEGLTIGVVYTITATATNAIGTSDAATTTAMPKSASRPRPITVTPSTPSTPSTPVDPVDPEDPEDPETPVVTVNFKDIEGHWAEENINKIAAAGIMNGVAEETFDPNGLATRGMINAMASRLAKLLEMEVKEAGEAKIDTPADHWAYATELVALANGWSNGIGSNEDGTVLMGTDANVTRQQLVTMIYRLVKAEKAEGNLDAFEDKALVADWAEEAMTWAVANGIVTGKSATTLDPEGNATRAEIATIYVRVMAYLAK